MMLKRCIFSLIVGTMLLPSCYSKYVHLKYDAFYGAQWNNDSTKIAFVASTKAFQNAKGLARFPDGGKPKYLVNDINLYLLDSLNRTLTKLLNFNDLNQVMRNRWYANMLFHDSLLYYKVKPNSVWELYLKWAKSKKDTTEITTLKNKYQNTFCVNIDNKNSKTADQINFSKEQLNKNLINLTDLNKHLKKLPVAEWGLKIQEIDPKPDSKYINDLIYEAKEGSPLTKRAIIEQIVSKMGGKEKRSILKAMDKHRNSLQGVEKTEYEMYTKEYYQLILEML